MSLYRGYSTVNQTKPMVRLTDTALIKQDLINHFNIRRGEKLMLPEFGTIIWDSLFEPFTEQLKEAIIEDVTRIVKYDPRLTADSVLVDQFEHGLLLEIRLHYTNSNETETLVMRFDRGYSQVR